MFVFFLQSGERLFRQSVKETLDVINYNIIASLMHLTYHFSNENVAF